MTLAAMLAIAKALKAIGTWLSYAVPIAVLPRFRRSSASIAFFWWLVLGGATNLGAGWAATHFGNNHAVLLSYRLLSVLLLGLTGYLYFADYTPLRQAIVAGTLVYCAVWTWVLVAGIESPFEISRFTSPAEKIATLLLGMAFVVSSIHDRDTPPLRQAASWLGIGLVLAGATGVAVFPIMASVAQQSVDHARLVKPFSSVFSSIALLLWCIPYWKRSVVWTR